MDTLKGYAEEERKLTDSGARETIKELTQLDRDFLISDDGIVISACRYIKATSKQINLPLGLGSMHMAAASITNQTGAEAVVVSSFSQAWFRLLSFSSQESQHLRP